MTVKEMIKMLLDYDLGDDVEIYDGKELKNLGLVGRYVKNSEEDGYVLVFKLDNEENKNETC